VIGIADVDLGSDTGGGVSSIQLGSITDSVGKNSEEILGSLSLNGKLASVSSQDSQELGESGHSGAMTADDSRGGGQSPARAGHKSADDAQDKKSSNRPSWSATLSGANRRGNQGTGSIEMDGGSMRGFRKKARSTAGVNVPLADRYTIFKGGPSGVGPNVRQTMSTPVKKPSLTEAQRKSLSARETLRQTLLKLDLEFNFRGTTKMLARRTEILRDPTSAEAN
jgi:hypothetical protein